MLAVHLAAGRGTRLRPLTDDRPKPLVELDGTSLLERNVRTLAEAGVDDQVVVTGYEADRIRDLGYDVVHNDRYDGTEMVYSLFRAADRFPEDEDLLVSYGDIVYDGNVLEAIRSCGAPLCVVVDLAWRSLWERRFEEPLADAEVLRLDEEGRIAEIGAEPDEYDDVDGQYVGLIKVAAAHVDRFEAAYRGLPATDRESIQTTDFLQHLVEEGWRVEAVPIRGGWVEVDTCEDLATYRDLLAGEAASRHVSWLR